MASHTNCFSYKSFRVHVNQNQEKTFKIGRFLVAEAFRHAHETRKVSGRRINAVSNDNRPWKSLWLRRLSKAGATPKSGARDGGGRWAADVARAGNPGTLIQPEEGTRPPASPGRRLSATLSGAERCGRVPGRRHRSERRLRLSGLRDNRDIHAGEVKVQVHSRWASGAMHR